MDLLQLKMPPDRVALVADLIDQEVNDPRTEIDPQLLTEISAWLRYRLARIGYPPPVDPAA